MRVSAGDVPRGAVGAAWEDVDPPAGSTGSARGCTGIPGVLLTWLSLVERNFRLMDSFVGTMVVLAVEIPKDSAIWVISAPKGSRTGLLWWGTPFIRTMARVPKSIGM
jgi:hypothetical protein